jgi:hypothetical protein
VVVDAVVDKQKEERERAQELEKQKATAKASKHNQKLKASGKPFIGNKEEAEEYQRDNELILGGYRVNHHSFKLIVSSLFKLHNESVNVWSHIAGAFVFIGLIFYTLLYLAPPGVHGQVGTPGKYELRTWFREFGQQDSMTKFTFTDLLYKYDAPQNELEEGAI